MPRITLVTTTAAAIPPELVARYGIALVPMQINFLDGQYEEGSKITNEDGPPSEIAVCHVNAPAEAQSFAERVRECFPQAQIYISDVGPVMAVHIGPGALGLATYQS
jgi:fatty acid-binding protein DegV